MVTSSTLLTYEIAPNIIAFSTTRISPYTISDEDIRKMGNYGAFNITHYCGDNPSRVARNRTWLCKQLQITTDHLWIPHQTHGTQVLQVDQQLISLDSTDRTTRLEGIDALTTQERGECIGISTADCIPILLYDSKHKAIAAIHAGWRGTVAKIVTRVLDSMKTAYGTSPEAVTALIGPGISLSAFEVGDEVVAAFRQAHFPEDIIQSHPGRKSHIDLWAANSYLLEREGVPLQQIIITGICTYEHDDTFFSARRLGIDSGRIYTGILMT